MKSTRYTDDDCKKAYGITFQKKKSFRSRLTRTLSNEVDKILASCFGNQEARRRIEYRKIRTLVHHHK